MFKIGGQLWSHIKCSNVSPQKYLDLSHLDVFNFTCSRCLMNELTGIDIDSGEEII